MKCKYCDNTHFEILSTTLNSTSKKISWLACCKCNGVLHEPPNYIPEEQHLKYLKELIIK